MELYLAMQLRQEVFVLEQKCLYLDADGKDTSSYHLLGFADDEFAAYARIVPPGVSYEEPSIGRVITSRRYRHHGFGKELMTRAITEMQRLYGNIAIRIGAQMYLLKFYEEFGFEKEGEPYLEDGIDHIIMVRKQEN